MDNFAGALSHDEAVRMGRGDVADTAIPAFFVKSVEHKVWNDQKAAAGGDESAGFTWKWRDKHYVRVLVPGDGKLEPIMPVKAEHQERWPRQWEAYLKNQETPLEGTPLDVCGLFRPSLKETLKTMNCKTVEAFINMDTNAYRKIGPVEHHGGLEGLMADAKTWLDVHNASAEKDAEITDLRARLERLEKKSQAKKSAPNASKDDKVAV